MRRHANWMKVLQDVGVFMYFVVFKNYSFFNLKIGVIDRFLFGLRILDELLTLVLKKSLLLLLLLLLLLYGMDVSCHRPFLPGSSLEPAVIPTAHASSFTLQCFPYYL